MNLFIQSSGWCVFLLHASLHSSLACSWTFRRIQEQTVICHFLWLWRLNTEGTERGDRGFKRYIQLLLFTARHFLLNISNWKTPRPMTRLWQLCVLYCSWSTMLLLNREGRCGTIGWCHELEKWWEMWVAFECVLIYSFTTTTSNLCRVKEWRSDLRRVRQQRVVQLTQRKTSFTDYLSRDHTTKWHSFTRTWNVWCDIQNELAAF